MNKKIKIAILFLLLAGMVFMLWRQRLTFLSDPYSFVVFDQNEELLAAKVAEDEQWRFPLMDEVPERFAQSLIVYEDQRFYSHPGVDFLALARALRQNLKERKIVSGASTLTMQLARMHYGSKRTIIQKFKEILFALKIDLWHSKKEILSYYSGHAPFGGNVVGLEAASWRYFKKSPDNLSWAESATLAALPNSPGLIHVNRNRRKLKTKRDFIIGKLYKKSVIDSIEKHLAKAEPLPQEIYELPNLSPHFLVKMKRNGSDGKIQSSLDAALQLKINTIANNHYAYWSRSHFHNAGIMVVDNRSRKILAYMGNIPGTTEENAVDMILAKRSTGSILKPLLFAAMLDEGQITPLTGIKDIPIMISGFNPGNYDGSFSGLVSASKVIQRSLNIPSVLMLRDYGIEKFLWKLNKLGFSSISNSAEYYGLSLILGGAEVTLWDLCKVYSRMARELLNPKENVVDLTYLKNTSIRQTTRQEHPFSKISIWQTFETMKTLTRPNEIGEWERYESARDIAWKTGTSYGHRDAWAVGVTPSYTIGIWVGNADGEGRDEIVGVSTAGKMLFDVLEVLPTDDDWFEEPRAGPIVMSLCAKSGMLASVHCEDEVSVRLDKDVQGGTACLYHKTIFTDRSKSYQVNRDCWNEDDLIKTKYFDLPPTVSKYYGIKNFDYKTIPPYHPNCRDMLSGDDQMQFVYPSPNDKIHLPLDLNGEQQELVVELNHKDREAEVFWYLDEEYIGVTMGTHQMSLQPNPGEHLIHCIDLDGDKVELPFSILHVKDVVAR